MRARGGGKRVGKACVYAARGAFADGGGRRLRLACRFGGGVLKKGVDGEKPLHGRRLLRNFALVKLYFMFRRLLIRV